MKMLLLVAAGSALVLQSPPALADRPAVEATMHRMEAAVLAGDPDAYLTNVATGDPIFLKEQQNWAKDLKLHVPSVFMLSVHEPESAEQKDSDQKSDGARAPVFDDAAGVARFEMVTGWTMPGLGAGGKDVVRTVSYPVVFRRAVDGRWLYEGEDWVVIESGRTGKRMGDDSMTASDLGAARPVGQGEVSDAPNRAKCFPGFEDVAGRVVEVLPEVRAHVDEGFGNVIKRVQEIKIYPSMRHLQESIYLSYVDGLNGWNEPGEAIKLLASNKSSAAGLRTLLAHEYGHVATFEFGPHASDMPWWVLEGVADLSAEKFVARNGGYEDKPQEYGRDARGIVQRWAKAGNLAEWRDITDFRSTKKQWMGHVYKQGQHMLGYISQKFGRDGRNKWLRAMAQGKSIDEATHDALGRSFDDLDKEWLATLPEAEPEEPKKDEAK